MTIRFSGYGRSLSKIDVAYCLLDAANFVTTHWADYHPIGPYALVTHSGNVKLQLVSTDDINWYQWGTAIRGITDFVKTYEAVQMDFSVLIPQRSVIAGGALTVAASNHT